MEHEDDFLEFKYESKKDVQNQMLDIKITQNVDYLIY